MKKLAAIADEKLGEEHLDEKETSKLRTESDAPKKQEEKIRKFEQELVTLYGRGVLDEVEQDDDDESEDETDEDE